MIVIHIIVVVLELFDVLLHLDPDETLGEKPRRKPHKDDACYLEQILEVAPEKAAAVWPLTSNLMGYPR